MKKFWNWLCKLLGFSKVEENPVESIKEMDKQFKEIVWFESCGQGLRQVMKPMKTDAPYIIGLPVSFIGQGRYGDKEQMKKFVKDYLESYQIIEKNNEKQDNKPLSANITNEYCGEDCKRCKALYHGGYQEGIIEGLVRSTSALNAFFRNNKIDCQLGIKDDNSDIDVKYNGNLYESIIEYKQVGGLRTQIGDKKQVITEEINHANKENRN